MLAVFLTLALTLPNEPSGSTDQGPLPPGHPAIAPIAGGGAGSDGDANVGPASNGSSPVSAKELLQRLDQMKAELKSRPKTAEIEFALGNLYYDNGRWPDAIDSYRQLLERAAAPLSRYLELRKAPHKQLTTSQAHCVDSGAQTFAALVAAGDEKVAQKNPAAALVCYGAALSPLAVALTRQANAWYLIGNDDLAIAGHRRALELSPDDPDSLFFLGAIYFESGDGDLVRLGLAKEAWIRFLAVIGPNGDPERRKLVTRDLARVQRALDNRGQVPREAPAEDAAAP